MFLLSFFAFPLYQQFTISGFQPCQMHTTHIRWHHRRKLTMLGPVTVGTIDMIVILPMREKVVHLPQITHKVFHHDSNDHLKSLSAASSAPLLTWRLNRSVYAASISLRPSYRRCASFTISA